MVGLGSDRDVEVNPIAPVATKTAVRDEVVLVVAVVLAGVAECERSVRRFVERPRRRRRHPQFTVTVCGGVAERLVIVEVRGATVDFEHGQSCVATDPFLHREIVRVRSSLITVIELIASAPGVAREPQLLERRQSAR